MIIEGEQIRSTVKYRNKRYMEKAVRLGDITKELMQNRISPQQARFGSINEIWNQLLPDELRRHCKITGISGGQLKVLVDVPAYMYELQLCSSDLLRELQQQCPRANIKNIKLAVGS